MALKVVQRSDVQMSSTYLNESSTEGLLVASILFIVLDILAVALRFISHRVSHTPLGRDDFLTLPALFFCLSICAMGIVMIKVAGVGRHSDALATIDPEKLINYRKSLVVVEFLDVAAITCAKIAILALYLRIFTLKPYRISAYVIGSIVLANWLVAFVLSCLKCAPFAYNWDRTIPYGSCLDINREYQWITFPSILTDVMILILPMRVVWKLQVSRVQKIGLAVTFLTGCLGIGVAIARFVVFSFLSDVGPVFNYRDVDDTWDAATLMIWTIVEPSAYLAASCFPTYRTFLQMALPKLRSIGSTMRTRKQTSPSTGAGAITENSNKAFHSRTHLTAGTPPSPSLKEEKPSLALRTTSTFDESREDLEANLPTDSVQQSLAGILVRTDLVLTRSN